MAGVLFLRFRDLHLQDDVNAFEPIPGIGNAGVLLQVGCHLVANQISMNDEKHGRQEGPAFYIVAAEDVLRPQD